MAFWLSDYIAGNFIKDSRNSNLKYSQDRRINSDPKIIYIYI